MIRVGAKHVSAHEAYADVARVIAGEVTVASEDREITDAVAVTIAAWWQASAGIGQVLASFASGCAVSREELLEDIARTRIVEGYHTAEMNLSDRDALDCLSTYIINA